MLEEFAPETSAAESWSPSTRRTLSIGSRELADVAAEKPVRVAVAETTCCRTSLLQRVHRLLQPAHS